MHYGATASMLVMMRNVPQDSTWYMMMRANRQIQSLILDSFHRWSILVQCADRKFWQKRLGTRWTILDAWLLKLQCSHQSMKARDRSLPRSLGSPFDLYNDYKRGSLLCSFWTATHQCKRRGTEWRRKWEFTCQTKTGLGILSANLVRKKKKQRERERLRESGIVTQHAELSSHHARIMPVKKPIAVWEFWSQPAAVGRI